MFNSALIYELAVLKQYAEPLLFGIPQDSAGVYRSKAAAQIPGLFSRVSAARRYRTILLCGNLSAEAALRYSNVTYDFNMYFGT